MPENRREKRGVLMVVDPVQGDTFVTTSQREARLHWNEGAEVTWMDSGEPVFGSSYV